MGQSVDKQIRLPPVLWSGHRNYPPINEETGLAGVLRRLRNPMTANRVGSRPDGYRLELQRVEPLGTMTGVGIMSMKVQ